MSCLAKTFRRKQVTIELPEDLIEYLEELAKLLNVPISYIVEHILALAIYNFYLHLRPFIKSENAKQEKPEKE